MASNKNVPIIIAICGAALIVVGGYAGVNFLNDFLKYDSYSKEEFIDQSTYQAVILTNDQVYFGRLKNIGSDYLVLSDVYYIRVNDKGNQLIKLGAIEPHGPEDIMTINRSQVLFWENLKPDSSVVKTIGGMKSKQ